ncbi:MAG: small multi-drug export protein [Candidatus Magasanikbacteria bacterium]|nr:small multi-drug export protein [Candidatus Magasanikbacteria bacterium]NCS71878.1 small multi-drug export protein [Candidatus Magasanikbacteria bacterium]
MFQLNPAMWFQAFPPGWSVFFLSMLPITELRASIPIGIELYHLPIWQTWIIAVCGNIAPTIVTLLLMPKIHDWVVKQPFIGGVIKRKLKAAEKQFGENHAKFGAIALVLFVGIPLPFTGAWTGSLAAFIFNIPFKKSVTLIAVGVCIAATIVTLLSVGAGSIFRFFL